MLQTVLLIAALVIMIGVGLWMAFFAYRNTSILAVLLGFMLSIGGVIYFAVQFEWGLTSLPVLIGSPLLALITAIVGAMVLPAGNVVGGALMGFLYGYNLMAAVDILLSGAIPAFLFTGSCILITLVCVVFCLVRHEDGPVLSSSFIGSFLMVYGVGAILTYFISGVSSAGGNMFAQFAVISSSMSGLVRLIIVIGSIILSIITMRVQSNSLEEDLDYDEEDDLWDEDEKDDEEDEDAPVLSKREQRRLEREARRAAKYADEDEDEDSFEDDEEDAPVLSKREQRRLEREARRAAKYADEEDEESFDAEEDAPVLSKREQRRAQTYEESEAPVDEGASSPASLNGTQVFRRVRTSDLNSTGEIYTTREESSGPRLKANEDWSSRPSASDFSPSRSRNLSRADLAPEDPDEFGIESPSLRRPSMTSHFTPRSNRRK